MLQLYNVYKKLWCIKLFSVAVTDASCAHAWLVIKIECI